MNKTIEERLREIDQKISDYDKEELSLNSFYKHWTIICGSGSLMLYGAALYEYLDNNISPAMACVFVGSAFASILPIVGNGYLRSRNHKKSEQ